MVSSLAVERSVVVEKNVGAVVDREIRAYLQGETVAGFGTAVVVVAGDAAAAVAVAAAEAPLVPSPFALVFVGGSFGVHDTEASEVSSALGFEVF